jgi:lipopolysaccharide export LptBFGC system permease protein LptF
VNQAKFLLFLVPQALPIALPMGLLIGILQGSAGRRISSRSRGTLLLMALVCSVASFATLGWLVPAGNQAFRQWAIGPDAVTLPNELTFSELGREIDSYSGTPMAGSSLVQNLKFVYHQRWALAGEAFVLALVALAVVPRRRVWRFVPLVAACAICFAYHTVLWKARTLGMSGALSPFIAAWLPNVVFALGSAALMAAAERRIEVTGCP